MRDRLDFGAINCAALGNMLPILRRWLPDGRVEGQEFVARNPIRAGCRAGT